MPHEGIIARLPKANSHRALKLASDLKLFALTPGARVPAHSNDKTAHVLVKYYTLTCILETPGSSKKIPISLTAGTDDGF